MSDFMNLCLKRQTCRDFADKPVEHDKLVSCVEAARLAPSGCNAQPWSFVVVEKPELVAQVAECAQQLGANAYAAGARAFVVVVEERATLMPGIACIVHSQYFAQGDLGAAGAYLCLEAEAQGLATCQFGIFDRPKLAKLLDIPGEKPIVSLFAVGYARDTKVRPKQRKPLDAIARFL